MEKMVMKMKKNMLILCTGLLLLGWLFAPELPGANCPAEVSAKVSSRTKRKAAAAYREFMDGADFTWFCTLDVDGDGMKELVLAYEQRPERIIIQKYRRGYVQRIGEDSTTFGFVYNKKTKRIHGRWGGSGSVEDWYLMFKGGEAKSVYLSKIEERVVNGRPVYGYYYKGKRISAKNYRRKKNSWNKSYVQLPMHRTSWSNINRYIR
ncbi:hypothetical protein AALA00_06465 [Lachnospiraceae bacterium 46-15]